MKDSKKNSSADLEPSALASDQQRQEQVCASSTELADEKMRASKDKVRSKGQKVRGAGGASATSTTSASRAAAAAAPNLRGLGKNGPRTFGDLVKTGGVVATEENTKLQKRKGLGSNGPVRVATGNSNRAPETIPDETDIFVGAFRVDQGNASAEDNNQEEDLSGEATEVNTPEVPQSPSVEPGATGAENDKPSLDSYLVEATLVTSFRGANEDVENNKPHETDVAPLVIAEKSQEVNFRSKRVMAGISLVLLVIVGLIIGLVMSHPPKPLFLAAEMSASGPELKNTIVAATNWGDLFNGMEMSRVTLLQDISTGPTAVPLTIPPTQTPNEYTVELPQFALQFLLFDDSPQRIPEDQEMIALLIETNRFYEDALKESNLTNALSFDTILQTRTFFQLYSFGDVLFRVVCSANVYFEPGSQVPSMAAIWSVMEAADYHTYILEYVHNATVGDASLFQDVQSVQMGFADSLTTITLTLPPTQAPNEYSVILRLFRLDFGFIPWWWSPIPDEVSEQEYTDLLIKTKDFYQDSLGTNFSGLMDWDITLLESQRYFGDLVHLNHTYNQSTFFGLELSAVAHFESYSEIPSSEELLSAMWDLDYTELGLAIDFDSAFWSPDLILFNGGVKPIATNHAVPIASPLRQPHNNTLSLELLAMEFEIGYDPRIEPNPSDEQITGLLNQMALHFNQTLGELFPNFEAIALVPVDSLVLNEVIAATPVFSWRLVFQATIYFELGTERPFLYNVLLGVASVDSASLLALVKQSEPRDTSIFKDTQSVQFIDNMRARTRIIEGFILKLGFFNGTELRPPSDEDLEGLYDQTRLFYKQTCEEAFNNFDAITISSRTYQFDATSEFPVLLNFSMNLYFQPGSEPPTKEVIESAFAIDTGTADYEAYITKYIWESPPKRTNFFVGTTSMVSLALEDVPSPIDAEQDTPDVPSPIDAVQDTPVVFVVSGPCRNCPVSNSTNNPGTFQLFEENF